MTENTELGNEREIRPTEGGADPEAFGGANSDLNLNDPTVPVTLTSRNAIIRGTTARYLDAVDASKRPHPYQIEGELIEAVNAELRVENSGRRKDEQLPMLTALTATQVAQVLCALHHVAKLATSRDSSDTASDSNPLVVYSPRDGIYVRSDDAIAGIVFKYAQGSNTFHRDVARAARAFAPTIRAASGNEWAAVRNGDLHRPTKVLHSFSPDRVFLSRMPVAYVPDAANPTIHNDDDGTDWDVDSFVRELAAHDDGTELQLWQLFAAICQPNVRTNKIVGLHNAHGNNGKGTVIQLSTNLAGSSNTLSTTIKKLGHDAFLPAIAGKSLVVSDENATNDFIRNAETLKLLATRDPILINPKYVAPYNTVFIGTQIHCLNALPRMADHGESMWRRWLFIPMEARFEGVERKYIRDDYIHRPEVLEYVLRRALDMDFTGFTETAANRAVLQEAKAANDSPRTFWDEHKDLFERDLLPLLLLWEMFKAWFVRNKPNGLMPERAKFDQSIRAAVADDPGEWIDLGRGRPKKASVHMFGDEELLEHYGLDRGEWLNVRKDKQYRNVLFRDRAAMSLAKLTSLPSPEALELMADDERLARIEALYADDLDLWRRRAVADDGVTDLAHVDDHARVRRIGHACGSCSRPSPLYAPGLYKHSADLDRALLAARAAIDEQVLVSDYVGLVA